MTPERLEALALEISAGADRRLTAFEHELISALHEAAAELKTRTVENECMQASLRAVTAEVERLQGIVRP